MKWELFWLVVEVLWRVALTYFIVVAISHKEWNEASMWLLFLILNKIPKEKASD